MLTNLLLQNFKPFFRPQNVPLAPITLVYGPNSAGKSSLIQALLLIKQTIEARGLLVPSLVPRGDYVDLGSFRSLISGHKVREKTKLREVRIGATFKIPKTSPGRARSRMLRESDEITVDVRYVAAKSPDAHHSVKRLDSSIPSSVSLFLIGEYPLALDFKAFLKAGKKKDLDAGAPPFHFKLTGDSPLEFAAWMEAILKKEGARRGSVGQKREDVKSPTKDELLKWLENKAFSAYGILPAFLIDGANSKELDDSLTMTTVKRDFLDLAESYHDVFRSISYLGPLRSAPERNYLLTGGARESVGVRGEHTPQLLHRRKSEFSAAVSEWFERFEIPYRLKLRSIGDEVSGDIIAINLEDSSTGVTVSASDVGFGIGQLLPIIVEGLIGGGKILCVEQPEIHLHPRLQAHIADLLIATSLGEGPANGEATQQSRSASSSSHRFARCQWIVETHSESLVLRLQRRIREGLLSSDDVSVLYVEPVGSSGSRVLRLHMDEDGDFISEWPQGFFEDSYREWIAGR